ncbi:dihydroorotate dehydrogenase electron transfer subunit [Sediminibacillus massiliensis]|uniref:dihydroorotate dehydrogenase electron transfer subunit n=1 Tax=Sediminibacillus massiliensis TaxID=1926277 RepID=UPI0009883ABC|nr:dihydroorotate dehydrogenase electron transfer subunit [Sediminibacillus massiliensis]
MKQQYMTVLSVDEIADQTIEMKLQADYPSGEEVVPGQFIHIKVDSSHMLRRPISVADVRNGVWSIIFKINGQGTDQLSKRSVGDQLDVLAPCGKGYPIANLSFRKALLIGGGIGVPPLYYLSRKLKERGIEVVHILGFQSKDHVFYENQFSALGKTIIVTNDGTYGGKGFVTNYLHEAGEYDYYFTCGPEAMLRAVAENLCDKEGYISIEQRMGCGIGACYACVVPTASGDGSFKKICKDGPVFCANEVAI